LQIQSKEGEGSAFTILLPGTAPPQTQNRP
jgi:chemotaxis protein histidine kinase CheA